MKSLAIRNLYPQVTTVGGEKYCWDSEGNQVEIDEAKVAEEVKKLQADYDAKQYQRDRLQEYPSIQELVVALYDEEDKASIIERRKAVKSKYPKPE